MSICFHYLASAGAFLALAGWYVLVIFAPYSTTGAGVGYILLLVASFVFMSKIVFDFWKHPVFWVSLLLGAYILFRSLLAINLSPEIDEMQNPHWSHFLEVMFPGFLLMGWWLARHPHHLFRILVFAVIGLIVGVIYQVGPQVWNGLALTSRYSFGYSPNYLGMVSGVGLVVVLVYIANTARINPTNLLLSFILIAVFGVTLLVSQSRSAWLAFVVFSCVFFGHVFLVSRDKSHFKFMLIFFVLPSVVLALVYFLGLIPLIVSRLEDERHTLSLLMHGDWREAAQEGRSIGTRLQLWFVGIQAVLEKPLLGWGGGAGQMLLSGSGHRHFHNFYIEFLVGYGIIGFSLFLICFVLLVREVMLAGREGVISRVMMLSLLYVALFISVALCFTLRIGQTEGRALLLMVMACYAFVLFRRQRSVVEAGMAIERA